MINNFFLVFDFLNNINYYYLLIILAIKDKEEIEIKHRKEKL